MDRAARAAAGLRALGVGEGDAIALLLRNDIAFFEATFAARHLGAYPVPINWHFTADEAGYIMHNSGAKVVIAHDDLLPIARAVTPAVQTVLAVATPPEIAAAYNVSAGPREPRERAWDDLIAAHRPDSNPSTKPRPSMIYTSGTTGRPKGVRREPFDPNAPTPAAGPWGFGDPAQITVLMNGPMYHSAPNFYGVGAFARGADIVLQARFDAEEMLALIERHRITHMHIVPTMFVRLLRLPDAVRARYDLGSLRHVVHGAGPCTPAVKQAMIAWWGPVIHEYYGSTETGLATWLRSEEALRKPGSVGRAMDNVEIAVFNVAGERASPGETGDIYIRPSGPDFTYLGLDERRREIGRDGFVTVGDIGYLDPDGYLFLCDRKNDMIISGGVNIYPAEVEQALAGMPGVRDCAVFGLPDAEYGERVHACVQADPGAALTEADVRAWLTPLVARYKIPSEIEFVADLPREDSGKIFKRMLRQARMTRV